MARIDARADSGPLGLLAEWLPTTPLAGRVYAVGGLVRDRLLGLSAKDLDLVVEEEGGAAVLARALHAAFPEATSSPHLLGRGYPIWSVAFRHDVELSGRVFAVAGEIVEIADTQSEAFPDPATRQRVTRFGTLEEDCARRDFTTNMLYLEPASGRVIDPSGQGLSDLVAGRLSGHPRVSLHKIFSEDPLRMLRLFRFHALFGWSIDPKVEKAVSEVASRFSILSAERVRDEMTKLLVAPHAASALDGMRRTGLLEIAFPELVPMIGCGQDRVYHSEGDVWTHTLMVVSAAPPRAEVRWAALLHDVGKPCTREEVGERVRFLGHEIHSARIASEILARLRMPHPSTERIVELVRLHLRGGDVQSWTSLRPARKLLRDAGEALEDLLDLITADSGSSHGPDGRPRTDHLSILREAMRKAAEIPVRVRPVLDGREIMNEAGLPPGPALGELIRELRDFEDAEAAEGRVVDRAAALEWLARRRRNSESG